MHNGLLPKYRGASPLVWAILNNEKEVGFTVVKIRTNTSDGDIAAQVRVPVRSSDHVGDVLRKIEDAAAIELPVVWTRLLEGKAKLLQQDDRHATHFRRRGPEDRKINWRWNARMVYNFVRAQSYPYPGAYAYMGGRRIVVTRASIGTGRHCGIPGETTLSNGAVVVVCGEESGLIIEAISIEGLPTTPNALLSFS